MCHVPGTAFKAIPIAMPLIASADAFCVERGGLAVDSLRENSMVVSLAVPFWILAGVGHHGS